MPVSRQARQRARALLGPGEPIRYVFPAEIVGSAAPCVFIVIGDRMITVLSTGLWRRSTPKSVSARFPRHTVLGPVDTQLTPTFTLGGVCYELDEEYVAVVRAADAEVSGADFLPADPSADR